MVHVSPLSIDLVGLTYMPNRQPQISWQYPANSSELEGAHLEKSYVQPWCKDIKHISWDYYRIMEMVAGISNLVKENINADITQDKGPHMFRFRWIDLEAKYSIFIWFTHPPVIPYIHMVKKCTIILYTDIVTKIRSYSLYSNGSQITRLLLYWNTTFASCHASHYFFMLIQDAVRSYIKNAKRAGLPHTI